MQRTHYKAALAAAGVLAACVPASVHAQQAVQVYGLVGTYVGSVKRSGEAHAVTVLNGGGLTTSFVGLKGTEDLGGNMKAIWALESFFRPDTGEQGRNASDPLWSRNAWAGIEGGFGRLTLGRQTNPMYLNMLQLSPFGSSVVFSPLALQTFVAAYGSNVLGDTVWNNVVQYATPPVAGFRASIQHGLGERAGHGGVANLGIHGSYTQGGLFTSISAQRLRVNGNAPLPVEQKAYLAGAAYSFRLVRLYGNAGYSRIDGGNASRLIDAGLSIQAGTAGTVMLETAVTRLSSQQGPAQNRQTTSVGYGHRLSRRTDVYVAYVGDKKSHAGFAGTAAAGVRHAF